MNSTLLVGVENSNHQNRVSENNYKGLKAEDKKRKLH